MSQKTSWLTRLQARWGLASITQVIIVLIVFACTGFTVLFLKKPIFWLLGIDKSLTGWLGTIIYLIVILPLYQILLLAYGFLFGQFHFFWDFEKKMFRRMFLKKSGSNEQ
jgi:hypothetical protein